MLLGPIALLDIMQLIRDSTCARELQQICYMKEFNLVIQMKLEHVLVKGLKKKKMEKKKNFKQRHVNIIKRANSSKIMI